MSHHPTRDHHQQMAALRNAVTLSWHDNLSLFQFEASDGMQALGPLVATDLGIREAQFRQGLRLNETGQPVADLLIGFFRGTMHVLATGLSNDEMATALGAENAVSAHHDHVVIGIDGPFAWELLGAWDTPSAIGLPYLGAYSPREGVLVLRAGRTGEYGYLLLVKRSEADAIWAELLAAAAMPVTVVGENVFRQASLENWVFEIEREGRQGLDALELQLTWRLDLHKDAVGLDAIRAHRERGLSRRITALTTTEPTVVGAPVQAEDNPIGSVLAVSGNNAIAIIDMPWAQAGMAYTIHRAPCRTTSAPFIVNRSLFVNPQRHSWATRDEIELPEGMRWQTTTSS